jgi:hypothetical protein
VPPKLTPESVRYWSDFNRVYLNPKSIVQLNEYELNSSLMPFETWTAGEDLFGSLDKEHDLLDRDLRPFVEEADQMQGIQVMTSVDDAWGGFAARYMDRLRDEYGKTAVWVWASEDGINNTRRVSIYPGFCGPVVSKCSGLGLESVFAILEFYSILTYFSGEAIP